MKSKNFQLNKCNVLIIGSGGAGLRAAIQAKSRNVSVSVISKRNKNDSHTVLAAGGINASFGNLDQNDSWKAHFFDTYLEGYGLGDPEIIEIMAKNSPELVSEIDLWGANFQKLKNGKLDQRFFGAHKYRRTCYSGDYTGKSILQSLLQRAELIGINVQDSEYVTQLLVEEKVCHGAVSFNMINGKITVHLSEAVILASGGHTGIWKRNSSRKDENLGDGYALALRAGCKLVDMEMVQFHPTGMVLPEEFAGTLVTEAVRGEGGILLNKNKDRFMKNYDSNRMELSTRDKIAIANYTEISEGRGTENEGVFLDISHKKKDFIINKLPKIYDQFLEYQSLDISKSPMEVAPTAHYSMGGIEVKPLDHSTNIKGLYAAGEVAGGLHGANRLGGNSLAEILVFGKITGLAAAKYASNLYKKPISKNIINDAIENIENKFQTGSEIILKLQNQLKNIMWENCGVIRNKEKMINGLVEINFIKKKLSQIQSFENENDRNFQRLVSYFDMDFSLLAAEATLKSAIFRKESRGSHQRSDFHKLDESYKVNIKVKLKKGNIEVYSNKVKELKEEFNLELKDQKLIIDFKGKLLE